MVERRIVNRIFSPEPAVGLKATVTLFLNGVKPALIMEMVHMDNVKLMIIHLKQMNQAPILSMMTTRVPNDGGVLADSQNSDVETNNQVPPGGVEYLVNNNNAD